MNRTHDLDVALRALDPADRTVDVAGPRAQADLRSILSTDPAPQPHHGALAPFTGTGGRRRPVRRVQPVRRMVLVGGTVAAVTAGLVVLPSVSGGDEAFATWTAVPAGLSAQERAEAADSCRASLLDGAGAGLDDALDDADPVVAERRGVWTTVLLAGAGGFSGLCVTDDSAGLFADQMIGSVGTPSGPTVPGPREMIATDLGVGTLGAGDISLVAGAAGADVVGVVYRSREDGDVTATLEQRRFALWLPGDELMDASRDGAEVEVTYRDGTTATVRLTL